MITRILWLFKQITNQKLVTIYFFSLWLILAPAVLADQSYGDDSSPDEKQQTGSTGTRYILFTED